MELLPLSSILGKGANDLHNLSRRLGRVERNVPLPIAAQIGLESYIRRGEHGVISELARQFGTDRAFIYQCRARVLDSLMAISDTPIAANDFSLLVRVDRAQLVRTTLSARVEANCSLREIMTLHGSYYGISASFGWVQNEVHQGSVAAGRRLREQDLSRIESAALDEMFSQGLPVLAGIDLDSEYLFLLKFTEDRKAQTWKRELDEKITEQGLALKKFVCDAGTGLCSGVQQAFPSADSRRDIFHLLDTLFDVLGREERYGYAKLAEYFKAEEDVAGLKAKVVEIEERRRRTVGWKGKTEIEKELERRNRELEELELRTMRQVDRHDKVLTIVEKAMDALEFIGRDGEFRSSAEATKTLKELADELSALGGKRVKKAATYMRNCAAAASQYTDELHAKLVELARDPTELAVVTKTAQLWRLGREEEQHFYRHRRPERHREAMRLIEELGTIDLRADRVKELMAQTMKAIERRARASSLIECLNSVLRPYLAVHKRVTQEALDLFCMWWNYHRRTIGKLKGTCPYEKLTGQKVHDWLSLIGAPQTTALH